MSHIKFNSEDKFAKDCPCSRVFKKRHLSAAGHALSFLPPKPAVEPAPLPGPSGYNNFLVYAGGPVLRDAELVSLYWGPFSQIEMDGMQSYLQDLARLLSQKGNSGQECVVRQYGISKVSVGAMFWDPTFPVSIPGSMDASVLVPAEIMAQQAAGHLPSFTNNRLFLVFTNLIVFDGYGSDWCAFHSALSSSAFFAVCPFPTVNGCGAHHPFDGWQSATSHEVLEALTDPLPTTGWVERLPSPNTEGGDVCAWQDNNLSFGVVQAFADNRGQTCSVFTEHLNLWHTIRFADGTWQQFGDVEGQTGPPTTFGAIAAALDNWGLRLCGVTRRDQTLWVTSRYTTGWTPFWNFENALGRVGILMDIGAAVISGDHHVCVTDDSGGLWHAIRSFFNSLWTSFGDVKGQAGNPGFLTRVSCAAVQGELHVAALDQSGDLWHCIRHANGTWTPMGSVKAAIGSNPGVFDDVAIAEVAGELHLAACGARVWHTIRHPDGSWTAFGDVKGQSGDPGMVTMLDASSVNGEFHLVVGTSTGQVFHTIRHSNGWTQFGDVFGQAGQKSRAVEVACAGYGGELQLAIEQNTFVRHGK